MRIGPYIKALPYTGSLVVLYASICYIQISFLTDILIIHRHIRHWFHDSMLIHYDVLKNAQHWPPVSCDYICSVDDNAELNQAEFFLIKFHVPLKWI